MYIHVSKVCLVLAFNLCSFCCAFWWANGASKFSDVWLKTWGRLKDVYVVNLRSEFGYVVSSTAL